MKYTIKLLLLSLLTSTASAQNSAAVKIPASLVKVHVIPGKAGHRNPYDGDGFKAKFPDGRIVKLRFAHVDAPEMKNLSFWNGCDTMQPYAVESRDFLASLVSDKDVLVDTLPLEGKRTRWSYDRMIVDAYLLDSTLIAEKLLENGTVWYSQNVTAKRRDSAVYGRLEAAFQRAKSAKKGIWGLKGKQITPNSWKKAHKNKPKE